MKKFISMFVVALLVFAVACPANTAYAAKIKLNRKTLDLCVGDTYELRLNKNIDAAWTSSDATVAIVQPNGSVMAVGEGKSVIKAKSGGKSYSCKITVTGYNLKYMMGNIGYFASNDIQGIIGSVNNFVYFGADSYMNPTTLEDILVDFDEALVQLEKYNTHMDGLQGEEYNDIKAAWSSLYGEIYLFYGNITTNRPSPRDRSYKLDTQNLIDYSGKFLDECVPLS